MGFNLGFKSVLEYPHGSQRIDVAWLDKDNNPVVCIEIEFSGSINNDLWKICEVNPELGVLVVGNRYLDTALKSVLNSRIIKLINQKLLIMDAFQHSYILIEGNRIIKTGSPLND